ncbi:YceI family protein [Parvicella tangerina]|uniref:Protein YceI n=1 Tax=Parvicella tangerina TaxID=2829795 RepID=A0A916JJR6_9FLAO|nr:YceI family protein [Parvicella tangerina]CAG5078256.1 Protein YceI [Parvicella tangerina]
MNNRIFNAIVLLIAVAMTGWFGFKSYVKHNKYDSNVQETETTVSGSQEKTDSGATINHFDHLNGTYKSVKTDPPTTELLFETYGTTATQGTFKDLEVSATFNGTDQASINVIIDVFSIYTAESTRDKHLKGEEFFNADKYGKISFSSNEIVKSEDGYRVKGDITFLGNTKSIEFPFTYKGSANGKENTEVFKGSFEFNPEKYGMESDAGDHVTVSFYTELVKQ